MKVAVFGEISNNLLYQVFALFFLVETAVGKLEQSENFVVDLYAQMDPYVVTDCSVNVLSGLLQRCADYEMKDIISVKGENVLTEEYYEFYADEEALDELILELFYAPKK